MKIIGLTGGIGSGKTTVANLIREAGIPVVDADLIAREIVEPGQPALVELAAHFGEDIIGADGSLKRSELAARAFISKEETAALNRITHPRIAELTQRRFSELERDGEPLVVWDMPLLIENGHHNDVDAVIVVDVVAAERINRLVQYRGLTREDAERRIAAQIGDEERRKATTFIIDNNGEQAALAPQVAQVVAELRSRWLQ
ncbi:MAG: dephospho-CoA kinase [Corynebacterium sp.]|uniref:dephospho-CoA kinase n=1 Tax=Corynebacterium sp. TaxID=1720 RepID=UPI0026DCAA01|nr:dephospho-CoA kinase [Corynebacterium sp.]MDO5098519.1 dephospho-CoA kinase [Corynebacterium sp.]